MSLTKLFAPVQIGTMESRNRIVLPAMATGFANPDGTVSDRLINYYVERAKGGAGIIIVEITCVAPGGKGLTNQVCVWGDEFIPGLKTLAAAVQQHGAKITLQLHHAGRQTHSSIAGSQPVAASAIPCPLIREMPRELTIEEVEALVKAFAEAARRAKEAGFDAVELHGAHGYLIGNFLSPFSNKRSDKYGGDTEGRMRFALEIIQLAREKVGKDYPIIFRLSADELVPGGLTLDESRIIARRVQDAGVDCLHVSAANYANYHLMIPTGAEARGCYAPLAAEIKKVVNVPVITVGRINDPQLANEILEEGKADLVAMGRPLIADPELPNKAKEGRLDDIRTCIACCACIDTTLGGGPSIICAVNAAVGKEAEDVITPAAKPKSVLIVGAGPAGLETARVAASRGHQVTLYDKGSRMGGQLLLAELPPHKQEISNLIRYLTTQVTNLGVQIKLGQEVTPEMIIQLKPEVVVVAAGSDAAVPGIAGVDRENVVTAREVIVGTKTTAGNVVIIGGGQVGCETAELLLTQGKQVTIVEMLNRIAPDMGPVSRRPLLLRLREARVPMETNTKVEAIQDEGVIVSTESGKRTIKADSVVLAVGVTPNKELASQLEGKVPQLYVIGDCVKGGKVEDAIREGFATGLQI